MKNISKALALPVYPAASAAASQRLALIAPRLLPWLLPVALFVLWWLAADQHWMSAQILPAPALVARCSRDGVTAGMCLSEQRIGGADLTFRFPRSWLGQWRNVAGAMDQLSARLHSARE